MTDRNIFHNEDVIKNLNFLCKSYDDLTTTITGIKNRLHALNPEMSEKHDDVIKNLESVKGKITRNIEKHLEHWPVWTAWMKNIPGVGPFMGGNLILLYYYRFNPCCKDCGGLLEKVIDESSENEKSKMVCLACGKAAKGDGLFSHKIDKSKEFNNVSKWWAYMGEHVIDGKKPKMKKGTVINWSPKGRLISYMIGESFNKMKPEHEYKNLMLEYKKKFETKYPEKSKGHNQAMARMKTSKIFLSHFWHVARALEGKSTRGVYADVIMQHTGIVEPFYWDGEV